MLKFNFNIYCKIYINNLWPLKIDIIKEIADVFLVEANIAEVVVVNQLKDNGRAGIKNVNIFTYIPITADLDISTISVGIYDHASDSWKKLENDIDFLVIDKGTVNIGDKKYKSDLIKKKDGEWHLYNNDKIKVSYKVKLPYGTHYILTRVSGYDSYNEKTIFEDSYTPIRIAKEVTLLPLEIKESGFEQTEAVVGKPPSWIKTLEVYNPNDVDITNTFSTLIFPDALNAYLIEEGVKKQLELKKDNNLTVSWQDEIKALERKLYVIKTITPPVIEVKKETEILQSDKGKVIFITNVTIENTALEEYTNVYYQLPIAIDKIIQLKYGEKELDYTDRIKIPVIKAGESKNIIIIYKEKVPALVTVIDKDAYQHHEVDVNFTAFVVSAEESKNFYLETEVISANLDTVFADIIPIKRLGVGQEWKVSKVLELGLIPPGEYKVVTKLRKEFLTILLSQNMFNVEYPVSIQFSRRTSRIWFILVLSVIIAMISTKYLMTKAKRLYKKEKIKYFEKELKKKEERISEEKRIARLEQQLKLLKDGFESGFISEEAYKKDKEKIENLIKKKRLNNGNILIER